MSLFVVNSALCLRDGACVDECPRFLIEIRAEGDYPTPIAGAEESCIDCGHCVAVCPTGALSLKSSAPEDLAPVRRELFPSAEQVDELLRSRRSIRGYESRPVPSELLTRLIDVSRYAASGSNGQPVEWVVVEGAEAMARFRDLTNAGLRRQTGVDVSYTRAADLQSPDTTCRGAPHAIVAHTKKGRETDAIIALTYLELAAYSLGLGACWSGLATGPLNASPELKAELGIPEGNAAGCVMLVGYARHQFHRVPKRNSARVTWR